MTRFFFNDTATTEIYTLSLHDALPISDHPAGETDTWAALSHTAAARAGPTSGAGRRGRRSGRAADRGGGRPGPARADRERTRLKSSHPNISSAVFCLEKNTTDISLSSA